MFASGPRASLVNCGPAASPEIVQGSTARGERGYDKAIGPRSSFCRRHDAALPLGFELVANAGRSVARRIGTDSYAPQCSAARLERLRVGRIARALEPARERVRALVVGIGGQ